MNEEEKYDDIEDLDIDDTADETDDDGAEEDVDEIEVDDDADESDETPSDDKGESEVSEDELFDQLNQLFLPAIRMQDAEQPVQESVIMEKNMFQLDDATKTAHLLSLCAMLIARAKNTDDYQKFIRASNERRDAKLSIQQEEGAEAKELATKYLNTLASDTEDEGLKSIGVSLLKEM